MKIEQLIVQYLYTNKKVTLQDIGIFYLSPNVTIPPDQDKDSFLPDNAISFEYNTKAVQDDNLIDFIVQQTRKIKPLATSDLESFTILGRQFMNIGKPLPIEGLGILQKNQLGEYEFIQGHSFNPKLEPVPALLKEKSKEDIVFTTPPREPQSKAGIVAAVIIFILLAGFAAYYFLSRNNKETKSDQLVIQKRDTPLVRENPSTVAVSPQVTDTTLTAPVNTSARFKVVLAEYPTQAAADNVFKKFSTYGTNLFQYATDPTHFRVAINFNQPLSDSMRLKDSLKLRFGGNPFIDLN